MRGGWPLAHGIGRRLVAALAAELPQQGCRLLLLWTLKQNPSCAWHERLGGQRIVRRSIELGECDITAIEATYGLPCIEDLRGRDGVRTASGDSMTGG